MVSFIGKRFTGGFVEIGRIVFVKAGPSRGKIALIIDIVDKNRCMIDGPCGRQIINLKRIQPTKLKLKIGRSMNSREVHRVLHSRRKYNNTDKKGVIHHESILNEWEQTPLTKKNHIVEKKKNFTDFDYFKYMLGKKAWRRITRPSN